MKSLTSLILAGSSLVLGACASKTSTNVDSAQSAIESSDSAEAEGNLVMGAVDGSDMASALTGDDIALRVAANVAVRWNPSGCVTVQRNGHELTIDFNDCTGPRGMVHVTGELVLDLSVALDGTITVHGTSDNMHVNGADLTIDLDAVYEVAGTSHTLTVTTHGSGTGPLGGAIERDGSYVITWDTQTQCGSIDGEWSTMIGDATRSNDVNLERCVGGCPTGTVVHHFRAGATLTITFDGTDVATFSASTGASGSINLSCGH